jgi:nicotinamidase-related amidase
MITAIDKHTALVIIDLQKGIMKMPVAGLNEVVENAVRLVQAFRKEGLPIVAVKVIPIAPKRLTRKDSNVAASTLQAAAAMPEFSDIVDELKIQSSDIHVIKHTWNAFFDTNLHSELQKRNITGIVLMGVSTSKGVEGTARAAEELGYNISFAIDAMADTIPEVHMNSLNNVFPRLGEQGTTAEIIAKLGNRV